MFQVGLQGPGGQPGGWQGWRVCLVRTRWAYVMVQLRKPWEGDLTLLWAGGVLGEPGLHTLTAVESQVLSPSKGKGLKRRLGLVILPPTLLAGSAGPQQTAKDSLEVHLDSAHSAPNHRYREGAGEATMRPHLYRRGN